MYKNNGKNDQHYLIYKFACFSCNPNSRPCLKHSITNSHSQVQLNGIFHQDWGPSGAPTPVILNLNDPIPFEWPPCLACCGNQALVYLSYWSQRQTAPLPISQEPLKNVYAMLISWILQRIMSSRSKGLHEINVSTDFQWSMQDLGYLVNITNFEFPCRKLNCAHVGIVQISIFS